MAAVSGLDRLGTVKAGLRRRAAGVGETKTPGRGFPRRAQLSNMTKT